MATSDFTFPSFGGETEIGQLDFIFSFTLGVPAITGYPPHPQSETENWKLKTEHAIWITVHDCGHQAYFDLLATVVF